MYKASAFSSNGFMCVSTCTFCPTTHFLFFCNKIIGWCSKFNHTPVEKHGTRFSTSSNLKPWFWRCFYPLFVSLFCAFVWWISPSKYHVVFGRKWLDFGLWCRSNCCLALTAFWWESILCFKTTLASPSKITRYFWCFPNGCQAW